MAKLKGIVLAGGSGSRLAPLTVSVSKQLLPVFDKPMVYYPLSTLMLAGIRDVMVIATPDDSPLFQRLLGDGSKWGMSLSHAVQPSPDGIAQAFLIGSRFIDKSRVCLTLGDNIFYGHGFTGSLKRAVSRDDGATIFSHWVRQPSRYGVAELDAGGQLVGIEEKPAKPRSNYAITGLYFYDEQVVELASSLRPSARGELEITDLNLRYLALRKLHLERLGRGIAWLDTGTHSALMQASNFIQTIEERQGLKVCCPEEIAFHNGWIDALELEALGHALRGSAYGGYLLSLLRDGRPS